MDSIIELSEPFIQTYDDDPITYSYHQVIVSRYMNGNCAVLLDGGFSSEVLSTNLPENLPVNVFRLNVNNLFVMRVSRHLIRLSVIRERSDISLKTSGFVSYPAYEVIV